MMIIRKLVFSVVICVIATVAIIACGGSAIISKGVAGMATAVSTSSPGSTPSLESTSSPDNITSGSTSMVHMSYQTFDQASITIAKGSSVTLVDDVPVPHHIVNGSWNNSNAIPAKENGAPAVNAMVTGNAKQTIGPFTTAGTYHLYCTFHTGMNLTVIVH